MPARDRRQEAGDRRAVVLLSGGLDSYTAAAIARAEGFVLFALTVRYGQLHACELDAARRVARALEVGRHLELEVDLAAFGGSALTGAGEIPMDRPPDRDGIPSTYVPARNTVLLSLALGWGLAISTTVTLFLVPSLYVTSNDWTLDNSFNPLERIIPQRGR